jgi:hypothetical protein
MHGVWQEISEDVALWKKSGQGECPMSKLSIAGETSIDLAVSTRENRIFQG